MRYLFLSAVYFVLACSLGAQNLPDAWALSADGRLLTAGGENASGFYDPTEVHEISLEFGQANWWQLLTDNYDSGTDLLATCFIDGVRYDSVGVRFKGETSYFRNNTEKKSFNVTLDYIIDGQDVDGYNTFNLNCGWEDNSSMREVLYNNVGHHYYMSLKANYANLTINGQNWGPYQSVQQFDSDFIREWYLSNDGSIWRATSSRPRGGGGGPGGGGGGPGGGGGGGNFGAGTSTLNYNGPDSTDYLLDYVLRRTEQENPWADLIAATDVLNNEPLETLEPALAQVLDIDKACWFLAQENIWADDDGYINKGGSDYFVYFEPESGRIVPMEYDGNSVLGDQAINWGPFYRQDDEDFPLINRMLAVPEIRQRYLAHVRVILEDYFTEAFTGARIDAYAALLEDLVEADPKKFYTVNQWRTAIADLRADVSTRRNLLLNAPEVMNGVSLEIADVSYATNGVQYQSPTPDEAIDVVANVGGGEINKVILHYGTGLTGPFNQTDMFDDGQHNDGAAGDGIYGAAVPPLAEARYGRYYIEAVANDAARSVTFEPKGAEHDVFFYQSDNTSAIAGDLVINEFMASNDTTQADQDGEFDDWVELFNNTDQAISLAGFHLSDDADNPTKFTFPAGTSIGANDYLIVWTDGDTDQEGLHTDFKLSAGGEAVLLFDGDTALVDKIDFPEQTTDISYGRFPNGTGDFAEMTPTFGAENNDGTVRTLFPEVLDLHLSVAPNPADGPVVLSLNEPYTKDLEVQLISSDGRRLLRNQITRGATALSIDASRMPAGMYYLNVSDGAAARTLRLIVK